MELSNLGKRIQKTGQNTIDKTKKATERVRLNSTISNLQKEIAEAYMAIGEIYFRKYSGDPPDQEMNSYFQEIENKLGQIDECSAQIARLNGTVQCVACGKEISSDVLYCNFCGARQTPVGSGPDSSDDQSLNKGVQNITNENNSPTIETPGMEDQSASKENKIPEKATPLFCNICGEKLVPGELFCPNCGEKVG